MNIGVRDDNPINIQVMIGNTVIANADNVNTGNNWGIKSLELSLNENYSSADFSNNVVLHVTEAERSNGEERGSYCGNYESVEFYNEGAEREAEIAAIAEPIDEVVTAREITRTQNENNFGTLSEMEITSEENYPSVFGEIKNYTECCDFTSGTDYYYVSVAETGNYSFAILAEGNGKTNLKIEKVIGTALDEVTEYSDISWTKVGSCHYVGSNGSAEKRTLYTHTTPEVELQQGLYKVTFSPATEGNSYYCDLIAIAGIKTPEPETNFVTVSRNLGVAEGTGTNEGTYATMFGIEIKNNGEKGAFTKIKSNVTSSTANSGAREFQQDIPAIEINNGASIIMGVIITGLNDDAATMTTTVE